MDAGAKERRALARGRMLGASLFWLLFWAFRYVSRYLSPCSYSC